MPARDIKEFSDRFKTVLKTQMERQGPELHSQIETPVDQWPRDPLAAARGRGLQYALNEWNNPENLAPQAAASCAGMPEHIVNLRRLHRELYALVARHGNRTLRYPKWQFDVNPDRLTTALRALGAAGNNNSWALHSFLARPAIDLDGMAPRDFLADASRDLGRLVQMIRYRFSI